MEPNILSFKRPEAKVAAQEWKYPPIYRVRGYYYGYVIEGSLSSEVTVTNRRAPVHYSLCPTDTNGYGNTVATEIRCMDQKRDRGWLIVREHETAEAAGGYIDALFDLCGDKMTSSKATFSDAGGYFTLVNRKPSKYAPDRLLIYITKYGKQGPDAPMDTFVICHPDGRITTDPDILYPFIDTTLEGA
jgi:hypothetical protein